MSLVLERRMTSRMYEFFYKETPEEREREYMGDSAGAAADDEGDSRLRAGRLSPRTAPEAVRGSLHAARADVPVGDARLDADRVRERHDARARLPVRRDPGCGWHDRSRRGRARHRRVHVGGRHARNTSPARSSPSISTRRSSTTTSRSSPSSRSCPFPLSPHPVPDWHIDDIQFDNVSFTYPGGTEPAVDGLSLDIERGELDRARRRERGGEEHARQAAAAFLRSRSRDLFVLAASISRDLNPENPTQPDRRPVPGLRQLRADRPRERRHGTARRQGRRRAGARGAAGRSQRLAAEEDAEGPRLQGREALRGRPRSVGRRVAAARPRAHHVPGRRHLDPRRADVLARSGGRGRHLRGARRRTSRDGSAS